MNVNSKFVKSIKSINRETKFSLIDQGHLNSIYTWVNCGSDSFYLTNCSGSTLSFNIRPCDIFRLVININISNKFINININFSGYGCGYSGPFKFSIAPETTGAVPTEYILGLSATNSTW